MNDLVLVHVVGTGQELLRPRLEMILRKSNLGSFKDPCQIVLEVFKDHENIFGDLRVVCVVQYNHKQEEVC